jgi:hypothetical protein
MKENRSGRRAPTGAFFIRARQAKLTLNATCCAFSPAVHKTSDSPNRDSQLNAVAMIVLSNKAA